MSFLNYSFLRNASAFVLLCFMVSGKLHAEDPPEPLNLNQVFKRIVSARVYHNKLWTLDDHDAAYVGEALSALQPTYVSQLIHLDAATALNEMQIQRFNRIQKKILLENRNCKFDFPINPNQYKTPEAILAKMQEIDSKLKIDIWYLDFYTGPYKTSSKVVQAAITYAHQHQQWIGGNELDKTLLKSGDFVAYTDANGVDLKLKEEIIKTGKQYNIPIVFQINNNTDISNDDTVHTYIKKWKTYERERHIRRLAKNQASWKYKLMYPVFFPVFLKQTAYNAVQDGDILKKYISIMNLYNELED